MVGRLYQLAEGGGPAAGRRAARPVRPRRRRPTAGQDLLRRHAPPARPRRRAGRRAAGAVPRRADHRARPAQPLGMWEVIADLVAGGTTLLLTTQYLEEADRLADRIVRHRPRPGHRPRHRRRAQGPGRRRAGRGHRRRAERHREAAERCARLARRAHGRRADPAAHLRSPAAPSVLAEALRRLDAAASTSSTSACAGRPRRRLPHPHRPRGRGRGADADADRRSRARAAADRGRPR